MSCALKSITLRTLTLALALALSAGSAPGEEPGELRLDAVRISSQEVDVWDVVALGERPVPLPVMPDTARSALPVRTSAPRELPTLDTLLEAAAPRSAQPEPLIEPR